jgi:hypothetical protein
MPTRRHDALVNIAHHGVRQRPNSLRALLCTPSLFDASIPISCVSDRTIGPIECNAPRQAAGLNRSPTTGGFHATCALSNR